MKLEYYNQLIEINTFYMSEVYVVKVYVEVDVQFKLIR